MNPALPGQRQLYASPASRYCMLVLAVLLMALLAVAAYAWSISNRILLPELERKAQAVATTLANEMTGALAQGGSAGDIQRYFDATLREHPDIAFVVLTGADGRVLYRSGHGGEIMEPERYLRKSAEIVHRYVHYGRVEAGVDRRYLRSRSGGLAWVLGAIALASLAAALEFLRCSVTLNVIAPMRQALHLVGRMATGDFRYRAAGSSPQVLVAGLNQVCASINRAFGDLARLAATPSRRVLAEPVVRRLRKAYRFAEHGISRDLLPERAIAVRVLAFVPLFGDTLARALLPIHAGTMSSSAGLLPYETGAALPLAVFMAGAATALPFAAGCLARAGRRSVYLSGAVVAGAALAATGLATDYITLCGTRIAAGAGYAMLLASCHGYVCDSTGPAERPAALVSLFGAMLLAELCGPLIGAVLAEQAGARAVFTAGGWLLLGAASLSFALLDDGNAQARVSVLPTLRRSRVNGRALALGVLSIAPSTFVYAAFPMLLAPLALSKLGYTLIDAAYILAAYGVTAVLLAPAFGRLGRRFNIHAPLACLGALPGGLGLMHLAGAKDANALAVALALLGFGHAMSIPAQLALAIRFIKSESAAGTAATGTGMYGLTAFAGAACGAIGAGALSSALGAAQTMHVLGKASIACAFVFALAFLKLGPGEAEEAPDERDVPYGA